MDRLEKIYEICKKKVEIHLSLYGDEPYEFFGSCLNGDYYKETEKKDFYDMYVWISSFVTGLAPLMYNTERNEKYLKWANKFSKHYRNKIFEHSMDTMHDIGFLYTPYSVAMYKLTGAADHRETAIKAADELVKRFDINGRYIDAWNRMDNNERTGRAIIDCMMNLSLLFWAWEETGHTFYCDIAKAHADTTKKYFIRTDYSVAHSFVFDRMTGNLTAEANDCGYGNGSHWARGTAWAVYGFAIAAKHLDNNEYFELSTKIAEKYISETGDAYIPVWDFRLPKELPAKYCGKGNSATIWDEENSMNCIYNTDTSAAAIMTCGLMELNDIKFNKNFEEFADNSLYALCEEEYFDSDLSHAGILKKQNGQMTYTIFGDYFFIEALQRKVFKSISCW